MRIKFSDYNSAKQLFEGRYKRKWDIVEECLTKTLPHLKASDQEGKQGTLIFDPVGTNAAIKKALEGYQWRPNVRMPARFSFLGTDVDFTSGGLLGEAQFSNYPFLLNNIIRSELLFKSKEPMPTEPIDALVIITKSKMFPSSNSTLYYEQAERQLDELSRNNVFDIPTRLVGLFTEVGTIDAYFTSYHSARYSRTVLERTERKMMVTPGRNPDGTHKITLT